MFSHPFFDMFRRGYERYPVAFHLPVWLLYITLPDLFTSLPQLFAPNQFMTLFGVKLVIESLVIAFFYLNYYVLTPGILRTRRPLLLLLAVLSMGVLLTLVNALYYHFFLQQNLSQLVAKLIQARATQLLSSLWFGAPTPIQVASLMSLLVLTGLSTGFALYRDRNQREAIHQQMVIGKKEAELSALKLQISPHFLFNTLNNMRWLARQKSDQTEDAIQRLSDILRYMIYRAEQGRCRWRRK